MYDTDVIIIGAGPTGLTLAIDLTRRSIPFRLVEASPVPFPGSRGKGLQPRTLEIFEDLEVIDAILKSGGLYPRLRIHLGPLSFRAGSLGSSKPPSEDIPYPNLWMVPQSRTEEILREHLRMLGGAVEFGVTLTTLTQDQQGVNAVLTNGETVRAQYLIGCDGAHSEVRKTLELSLQGDALEEKTSTVADLEVPTLDRNDWHVWPFAKGGAIGLCPLPGTSLFQFTGKAEITVSGGLEEIVFQATGHRVERVAWSSSYRPTVRMVERYRVRRVLLAGDAAHVHPPAGGQGLNTGVQDAYNLGWKLAHVVRGGAESLLDSYEEERLPVAAAVLGLSKRLHQTRSIKRGDATNQLALHYRTSSLSSGNSLGKLHPGDRMPDRRFADGSRLFEHLRGCHVTQLISEGEPGILIRPDGYVASIGPDELGQLAGHSVHTVRAAIRDK
jgi:2-polyprenyl-6-methoxyphenol hydroxylase-like FAD-dependent oxidoreductase